MKKILAMIGIVSIICTACGTRNTRIYNYSDNQKPRQYAFNAFDTECMISLWGVDDDNRAEDYYYSMKTLIDNYDKAFSKTNAESEIYAVNNRTENVVYVSEEVGNIFNLAKDFYDWSNGKFDISAGKLFTLWDVKNRTSLPTQNEIDEAKTYAVDFDYEVEFLDGENAGKQTGRWKFI